MSKKPHKSGRKRAGSRILLEITALVVILFISAGAVSLLFFRNSQGRLIQESKDKLIENRGNLMCSTNEYVVNLQSQIAMLSFPGSTPESMVTDIGAGIAGKTVSPQQEVVNEMLRTLMDNGFWNSTIAFYGIPAYPEAVPEPTIIMSSDNGNMYNKVPAVLVDLMKMGEDENRTGRKRFNARNAYEFFEGGVPELGLEGEYLVSAYRFSFENTESEIWYFVFSSMHDELGAIDSYYNTERKNIEITLILVMISTIIALVVITFFVLSYLIRKKITKPIDELEVAAEQVMEGDLDVQVPVREGEEFYGLKTAFNNMVASLRVVMSRAMGTYDPESQSPLAETEGKEEGKAQGKRRGRRSSILFPATVVIVIIFIISGALGLLFFQRSQSKLVEKSKEQVVRSEAEGICSGHLYVSTLLARYYTFIIPDLVSIEKAREILDGLKTRQPMGLMVIMNTAMKDLIDEGFDGLELVFYATPGVPGVVEQPIIIFGSDEKYIFEDLPGELVELRELSSEDNGPYRAKIDEDNTYMLAEDGVSELGLKGEYLVTSFWHKGQTTLISMWFYGFKPMGEQLAEIDAFYDKESRTAILLISIMMLIGIIGTAIITFFVLSHLIKSRITKPVDELSAIAEEVMEGNLEIEIPITRGEEFEGLKRAFSEMLNSLNDVLGRSTM